MFNQQSGHRLRPRWLKILGWADALFSDDDAEEISSEYPRCDYCGLPAVCFGANLVAPKHRCPIHCRQHRQFGGFHGSDNYLSGHMAAEGYSLPTGATDDSL